MDGPLLFGRAGDPLSNFARSPLHLACPYCQAPQAAFTVEHGFQAAKATRCEDWHHLIAADGPKEARARGRQITLRPDWDSAHPTSGLTVKATVMLALVGEKFRHEPFRSLLLGTGTRVLIEDAPWDGYWGPGADGHGRNALGRLLMKVREDLRTGRPDTPIPGPTPPVRRT